MRASDGIPIVRSMSATETPLLARLITIASFVPIGFAQSAAGEYTFSIFAVVTIALLVSWVVAVLFDQAEEIGAEAMIGPHCYITDHDHTFNTTDAAGALPLVSTPTRIGAPSGSSSRISNSSHI